MNDPAGPNTHDARAVANYRLDLAAADGRALGRLKSHTLVYHANGSHLGLTDRPLVMQTVFAGRRGPVVKAVADAFRATDGPVRGRQR